jgi:hypothetical protein
MPKTRRPAPAGAARRPHTHQLIRDSVCRCVHWYEEHARGRACGAPDCTCKKFVWSASFNTPRDIADRGGDHSRMRRRCHCALCRWERRTAHA